MGKNSANKNKTGFTDLQVSLARGILEHVYKLQLSVGEHLKEQDLAATFRVSRSPIRAALSYLANQGILKQEANRGFFLNKNLDSIDLESIEFSESSDEALCRQISKDWFLKRVPQNLSEAEFRRRYQLGRLSMSRILVKLSEEGIISRNSGSGWRFEPTLNTEPLHDASYEFRMLIEPAAILLPSFKLEKGLADLSRLNHERVLSGELPTLSRLFDIDAEFHKLIGVSCGNPFFLSSIERQSNLRQLVEYESLLEADRTIGSCKEHMGILDAIESGDMEMAAVLMQQHLLVASRMKPAFD